MFKSLRLATLFSIGIVATVCSDWSRAATYTFENLVPDTALFGQDNWVNGNPNAATHVNFVQAGVGSNTSLVARYQSSTVNSTHLHRQNDGNYSFPAFAGTETNALFEFDVYFVSPNTEISLSLIENGQPLAGGSNTAPFFGISTYNGVGGSNPPAFMFRKARFGALTFVPIGDAAVATDWLRLRMDLDFTANFGEGSASISYKNLTNGDTTYTAIDGLQGLNAGLSGGIGSWDTMYLRFDGPNSEKRADNLTIGLDTGPLVPGDFNGDGNVDGLDFVAWQNSFPVSSGASLAQGDADADGDVDGADFVVWQTNFPFMSSAGTSPVPEPQSFVILAIGGLLALWRRRK